MNKPPESVYASATRRIQLSRYGAKLVMVVMAGEGAILTTNVDFNAAQKWAMKKNATGSPNRDRMTLFDRIECFVSRPGSAVSTKGNEKQLEEIVRLMKEVGLDPKEWLLPPKLRDDKKPGEDDEDAKEAKEAKALAKAEAAAAAEAALAPVPPPEEQGSWIREKTPAKPALPAAPAPRPPAPAAAKPAPAAPPEPEPGPTGFWIRKKESDG